MAGEPNIQGIKCFSGSRNTGKGGCPIMPKVIKAHIAVPFDFVVSVVKTATPKEVHDAVLAAMAAAMINDSPSERAGFFGRYTDFEDKSEAPTAQKHNLGSTEYPNDGTYSHDHMYTNGGQAYHNSLIKFRNRQDSYKVITIEDGNMLRMVRKENATDSTKFDYYGIELDNLYVHPFMAPTQTEVAKFRISLTYASVAELNEDSFVIKSDKSLLSYFEKLAVTDVFIVIGVASDTAEFPITATTVNGEVNVADTFGETLADPLAWKFINKQSGVTVDVLSVIRNVLAKTYTIALDVMSSGYNVGDDAVGGFAAVGALTDLGLKYFESNTVTFEMD